MSPLRTSLLCAAFFGCSLTKPVGEDTGPESSGFADGSNFDEATSDDDVDVDDGTGADESTDGDLDMDADDGGTDEGTTTDGDADGTDDDTGLGEDTATETVDDDGGTDGGTDGGSGDGASSGADDGSGSTSGAGVTDGSGSSTGGDAAPTFIPENMYIQWTASFQDGLFVDTLYTDTETGVVAPTDNFIWFLATTAAFDAEDASSFCLMQFYIDEVVPTDFVSWTGWDSMAFELDTTVGATPPSAGCAGMAAAMGIEDPVSDFLATFPWAFGYGPMKSTWADELTEVAEEDFTSLGDAAGTVHLRYSTDESEGLTEWGYFEVNPYDSDMLIDAESVVRGVSSAAEPPDGRYVMSYVYMITFSTT